MCRLCTASLFCVAGSVTRARVPASLPVPDVVGDLDQRTPPPAHPLRADDLVDRLARSRRARRRAWPGPWRCRRRSRHEVGLAALAAANAASRLGMSGSNLRREDGDLAGQAEQVDPGGVEASATTSGRRARSAKEATAAPSRPELEGLQAAILFGSSGCSVGMASGDLRRGRAGRAPRRVRAPRAGWRRRPSRCRRCRRRCRGRRSYGRTGARPDVHARVEARAA